MIYLITYDIPDNKTRFRVAGMLERMGERVQESVFECRFPSDKINRVTKELANLIQAGGNIRIYPLHSECYDNAIAIGEFTKTLASQGFEII